MAKGNMFQGMARGKVGDVVFSRLNGEQISRVRNRHPKNPRTNAQLYQRAIMASVMQAYSVGKEIFDHSFQGKSVGMDNQREFMSRNMTILRNLVKNDIENGATRATSIGRLVSPGSNTAVPFAGLLVSRGTLTNDFITIDADSFLTMEGAASAGGKTPEAFFAENGVSAGDIFTIVILKNTKTVVYTDGTIPTPYNNQYNSEFGWLRFIAKTTLTGNISPTAVVSDIFDLESGGTLFNVSAVGATSVTDLASKELYDWLDGGDDGNAGVVTVIRSRRDLDVRSTAYMQQLGGANNTGYGITSIDVLNVWTKEIDNLGNSELILEGGEEGF